MVVMVRIFLELFPGSFFRSQQQNCSQTTAQCFNIGSLEDSLDHKILDLKEILEIISSSLKSLLKMGIWWPGVEDRLILGPRKLEIWPGLLISSNLHSPFMLLRLTRKRNTKQTKKGKLYSIEAVFLGGRQVEWLKHDYFHFIFHKAKGSRFFRYAWYSLCLPMGNFPPFFKNWLCGIRFHLADAMNFHICGVLFQRGMWDSKRQHRINKQISEKWLSIPLSISFKTFSFSLLLQTTAHNLSCLSFPILSNAISKWVRSEWQPDLELIYEKHSLENVLKKWSKEEKWRWSVVHICPCIHFNKCSWRPTLCHELC